MSKKTRYMDTTKGYSRAAHKAVTMAVVDEDYYEGMLESEDSGAGFMASAGGHFQAEAAATAVPTTRAPESRREPVPQAQESRQERQRQENGAEAQPSEGRRKKKRGLLNRVFGALRGLG